MADNDAHIAEVVAGENKVYVDTGIFPTAERRHMADRVQGNEAEREGKNNFDDHTISAIIKSADMVMFFFFFFLIFHVFAVTLYLIFILL